MLIISNPTYFNNENAVQGKSLKGGAQIVMMCVYGEDVPICENSTIHA